MDLGTGIVDTALNSVAKMWNYTRKAMAVTNDNRSLAGISKLTRVEPLAITSKDCLNLEYLPDLNSTLLNYFVAYYLQSVNILTKVKDVEVIKLLDKLNPNRDLQSNPDFLGLESDNSHRSMVLKNYRYSLPMAGKPTYGMEDVGDSGDLGKVVLQDVSNLAIGKLVNIELAYETDKKETKSLKLPINFRLIASVVPNHSILSLLTHHSDDTSFMERVHGFLSGRIQFIRDFILCQDLIDEWRKAAIADESGTIDEVYRRAANSKKFGLLSSNPSLATAANLVIISKDVAKEVEAKLGGKLSNMRTRQKAFENTYGMIMVVVDKEWERVTIYVRDQDSAIDLSVKEIKKQGSGKGPDIGDILKAFTSGMPAF